MLNFCVVRPFRIPTKPSDQFLDEIAIILMLASIVVINHGVILFDNRVLVDEESKKDIQYVMYFGSQESCQDRPQGLKKTNAEHSRI